MGKTLNDLPFMRASRGKRKGETNDFEVQYTRGIVEKKKESGESKTIKSVRANTYPALDIDVTTPARIFDRMKKKRSISKSSQTGI